MGTLRSGAFCNERGKKAYDVAPMNNVASAHARADSGSRCSSARLSLAPCSLEEANTFVAEHHRHHLPTPVAKFSIMATSGSVVVGVVIVGIPKARLAMDGWTLEVTRLATDGTRNACSLLYGAARRAAFALGYTRVLTYTLAEEDGASLRAAGFTKEATIKGESWKRRGNRFVDDRNPIGDKTRWCAGVKCGSRPPRIEAARTENNQLQLFCVPESAQPVEQPAVTPEANEPEVAKGTP